jgi:hypothetical protein
MTFSELLVQLGMETKLDLSAAAAAGGCTIQFDKNLEVVLEADAQTGAVQMYIAIVQAPTTNRENFFASLLQLHLFGMATDGAVFGFDPQLNRVLFFKTLPLSLMDADAALKQVEAFVNQAERWRDRLLDVVAKMAPNSVPSAGIPVLRA